MGFTGTLFGGKEKQKTKVVVNPRAATTESAIKQIQSLVDKPLPDIPQRGIADLPEQTPERALARKTATDLAAPREERELLDIPTVQSIIQVAQDEGNLQTNRLARILQSSGNITSTTGRDVLGRSVGDIQARITERLTPIALQERSLQEADVTRRQNLIPQLERLGFADEAAEQAQKQAILDSKFARDLQLTSQDIDRLLPLLQTILQADPGVSAFSFVQQGSPGLVAQVGEIADLARVVGPTIAGLNTGGQTGFGQKNAQFQGPPQG